MTLLITVDVECDHDDCATWEFGDTGRSQTTPQLYASARRRATDHGWAHVSGKDYCPEHNPKAVG